MFAGSGYAASYHEGAREEVSQKLNLQFDSANTQVESHSQPIQAEKGVDIKLIKPALLQLYGFQEFSEAVRQTLWIQDV